MTRPRVTRGRIILLLIVLIGGLAAYWVHENVTWEEVRVSAPVQGEAARNNLLAAARLVTALGGNTRSQFGFKELPPGDPQRAALIFPTQRRTLSPRQRQQIFDWVQAGGHLVVVTYTLDPSENENEDSPADLMLDTIGVRQYLNRDNKTDSESENKSESGRETKPGESMPRTGNPPPPRIPRRLRSMFGAERNCPDQRESGQQAPRFKVQETSLESMKVCFDPQFRLESKGEKLWEVKSIKGAHVLSVPQGKGEITVLTDYDFMQNEQIGQADHADFLLALLAFTPGMTVWFIPREEVAGIMALTWRYGWPALLALAAWLALTLWRTGARFGPLKPAPDATRRSIAEHIRANGEFLWRHGEAASLWQSTIADVKRRIERTLPPAHNRSDRDLLELLAKKSGLGIARLEQAFYPQAVPSAENFSRAISTLEYLRKHL